MSISAVGGRSQCPVLSPATHPAASPKSQRTSQKTKPLARCQVIFTSVDKRVFQTLSCLKDPWNIYHGGFYSHQKKTLLTLKLKRIWNRKYCGFLQSITTTASCPSRPPAHSSSSPALVSTGPHCHCAPGGHTGLCPTCRGPRLQ